MVTGNQLRIARFALRWSVQRLSDETGVPLQQDPETPGVVPKRIGHQLGSARLVPDAFGLALFSIVGAGIAIESDRFEVSLFVASLFGVITGAFGGVIADTVCNEVPRLFLPTTPLYSICAFVGCWAYLLLRSAGVDEVVTLPVGVMVVVVLRLMAVRWNWRLPVTGP